MARRRLRTLTLCVLVAWALAGCALAHPFTPQTRTPQTLTPQTLAQDGGLRVTVQIACSAEQDCAFTSAFAQTMRALQQRARVGLGVPNASVKRLDGAQIEVDLPGYTNQQTAASALTTQGLVQFIETSGVSLDLGTKVNENQYPVLFTGAQLDPGSINETLDQNNLPIVTFEFQGPAHAQFAAYTRNNAGDYLTITVDNVVIESAQIQSEIDGEGEINGFKSLAAAQALAAELKSPPLPAPVTLVSAQVVSASGA